MVIVILSKNGKLVNQYVRIIKLLLLMNYLKVHSHAFLMLNGKSVQYI